MVAPTPDATYFHRHMPGKGTNIASGFLSLGADINKRKGEKSIEFEEGVVSDKLPELTLDKPNKDLIKLAKDWEKIWVHSSAKTKWEEQGKENEEYWLGKHFDIPTVSRGNKRNRPMMDNVIFEALETYLPQATRRNPDPLIMLHPSEEDEQGNAREPAFEPYVSKVKARLADLADENKLRLKLKKATRFWAVYLLGVAKMGWDFDRDIPIVQIVRPKKILLDPEAIIDEDGYSGTRIGEYRKMQAGKLKRIIESDPSAGSEKAIKKIDFITKGEDATEVQFIEWWTQEFFFWKLDNTILLKKKNLHWNYDGEEEVEGEPEIDEFGEEQPTTELQETKGINHFTVPKMPYIFLTVYNLGKQPMDDTSLIGQNLAIQDVINKRNRQIDKNVDSMNGGMVVSLARSGLTKAQATGVTEALRRGGTVVIPDGTPRDAVDRMTAPGLPADVFNHLVDSRNRLRDIFGTSGSSPAGISSEDTVRGKIINKTLDTDRIGGGVSEYLEQFSDDIYNWIVQLLYVYDDDFQFIEGARPPKISVSVKEGSLLPKDSTTIANQAIELANANKMSTIDLYKRLEYPNPEELAANSWLEVNAPHILFKDNQLVQEALQGLAQAASEEEAKANAPEGGGKPEVVEEGESTSGSILSNVQI